MTSYVRSFRAKCSIAPPEFKAALMALRAAEAEDSSELAAVPLSVPVAPTAPAVAVDVGVVRVRVLFLSSIS